MFMVNFINAQQNAFLVLPQVGEPLQINRHGDFKINFFKERDGIRHKVMVLERGDRQFDPSHAAHLLGPETGCIDHMLTGDHPLVGDDAPAVTGLFQFFDLCVFVVFGPALAGGDGIGVDRARGINIALTVSPHPAQQTFGGHDGVQLARLLRRDQPAIADADGLENPIGRLQPFPPVRRSRHGQPAGHVQADIMPAFFLNLGQQINGVGLQGGDIRISVKGVDTARRVPG
ncbi:MAG: Uncharacterised protein [SAR116 cluster bacterium MED-G04]|nr:MAG: Uncharacterised protein [SAR116 cluster bacterium MED-G04]